MSFIFYEDLNKMKLIGFQQLNFIFLFHHNSLFNFYSYFRTLGRVTTNSNIKK